MSDSVARIGWLERRARTAVLRRLAGLRNGRIEIREGGVREVVGPEDRPGGLRATVEVHDPAFWIRLALGGSVGAGEAYMDGLWSVDDLTTLVRIVVRNRDRMDGLESVASRLRAPFLRLAHRLRDNTRRGSRRNVEAHYDLGNDFFELFLDPTMMYSCAVFERGDDLETASRRKLDLVCRKLGLEPGDDVLELGTGWGGFAVHAAGRYGCRVVTTTISPRQRDYAVDRVRREGLEDRVTVLLHDYRDLPAAVDRRFDKLVSIEMIEAVGLRHLDGFFATCDDLLKPGGLMMLQAIVISERLFDAYRRSVDFIQRHVFPGGALPSIGALSSSMQRASGLAVLDLEDIGPHYPTTLARWRDRFLSNLQRVRDLGYPPRFARMWEFYLGYCEGGFLERAIGDVQMLLAKPGGAHAPQPAEA